MDSWSGVVSKAILVIFSIFPAVDPDVDPDVMTLRVIRTVVTIAPCHSLSLAREYL